MRENIPFTEGAERLRRVELLANLSSHLLEELTSVAEQLSLGPGALLFAEGDRGDAVYVVVEGAVQVFVQSLSGEELVLGALRAGELLGEHYLFQRESTGRRGASARASEQTTLLRIEGTAFFGVLTRDPTLAQRLRERRDRREADNLEKRSEMFRLLTSLGAVDPQASVKFDSGEIIFREGDEADAAWLITAGEVCVYAEAKPDEHLARLGVGQCFGERACVSNAPRGATVRALTTLEAVRISREHFARLHELSPQLRDMVSGLEFVYHLPTRGIALQFFSNRGSEGAIERLYRLQDGRRFLASWIPALKAFRLERIDRADTASETCSEAAWAEAAIGEPARQRAIRLSQDGRIRSLSAVGDWPEMPRVIEAAIDGQVFGADAIQAFEGAGRLDDAGRSETEDFACFCMQISGVTIETLIRAGYDSFESLRQKTGCGSMCGGCEPQIQSLLGRAEWTPMLGESQEQTPDIRSFVLKPSCMASINWLTGQHVVVSGRIGPHWVNRSYTIISAPGQGRAIEIAVKREPQGLFSRWLFDGELAGKELRIAPPRGDSIWTPGPHPSVCLVAGIGVTPALAILRARRHQEAAGPLHIDYSGRAAEAMAYLAELQSAAETDRNVTFRCRFTSGGQRLDAGAVAETVHQMPDAEFFICGPPAYMDQVLSALRAAGVPPERIHDERFAHAGAPPRINTDVRHTSASPLTDGTTARVDATADDRYRITRFRTLSCHAVGALPPMWREWAAERYLRRGKAPGPVAEHVLQYLSSVAMLRPEASSGKEATVAKRADNFYERQYRQFLNPVMGAFAMTASRVLLASGGPPRGNLWSRSRHTYAAVLEEIHGAPPIMVIDQEIVALPLLLPRLDNQENPKAIENWLGGRAGMPLTYSKLVEGEPVPCSVPHASARERTADGAVLEVINFAVHTRKLAMLALHPHDPDAMGLHITLFAVEVVEPERLQQDYGLAANALGFWQEAALRKGCKLVFCVGATEEVFTQCSQNLFIKRSIAPTGCAPAAPPIAWKPALPLERLLAMQFETMQVTVSSDGVPGASPRNGDVGKTLFLGRKGRKSYLLIPYHTGNAVHGHAAKLWSNRHGTIVIHDDHSTLRSVSVSGPSWVLAHEKVKREFPMIVRESGGGLRQNGTAAPDPEYWFLQEVAKIVQQREPLAANSLDAARPTCSISAGGEARHDKKVAYFAANTLPAYKQSSHHEREKAGRPADPSGSMHRIWSESVRGALDSRLSHLRRALGSTIHPSTKLQETRE